MNNNEIGFFNIKLQDKYFTSAKNISKLSNFSKQHLGAIFVYKRKIIASESNTYKTNPLQKEYNRLRNFDEESINNGAIHAEMRCLLRTKYMDDIDWPKVHVFIYREHKNKVKGMARPCEACMQALQDRGIKKIYYTTENGFACERMD